MATVKVKLVRSGIGRPERQKKTLKALGLKKLQQTKEYPDNPSIRGMIFKVQHLIEVVE
ncbi:50S ribosomal protein L30 [Magnetococcales bacterium HHB-1]